MHLAIFDTGAPTRSIFHGSEIADKTHATVHEDCNGITMRRGVHTASQNPSRTYDTGHRPEIAAYFAIHVVVDFVTLIKLVDGYKTAVSDHQELGASADRKDYARIWLFLSRIVHSMVGEVRCRRLDKWRVSQVILLNDRLWLVLSRKKSVASPAWTQCTLSCNAFAHKPFVVYMNLPVYHMI
jgi:hypothetical protein